MKIEQLAGPSVLVPGYISDGPGYAGPLIFSLAPDKVQVITPKVQRENGDFTLMMVDIYDYLPTIASTMDYQPEHAKLIFENLSENSRHSIEDPSQIDDDRVAMVRWSNGSNGAIIFWGESCFVSAIYFDGIRKGEVLFNLEDCVGDLHDIAPDAAIQGLLLTPNQIATNAISVINHRGWTLSPSGELTPESSPSHGYAQRVRQ